MKKGFTLAEILLSLGIIGIIAALTLPTLNLNTKEKSAEALYKVCVSDLENAFTTMMATEGVADLEETKAFAENNIIENLEKYIKISGKTSNACILKNGAEISFPNSKPNSLKNKDGDTIDADDYVTSMTIDINGPNVGAGKSGDDVFNFAVLTTGFLEELEN